MSGVRTGVGRRRRTGLPKVYNVDRLRGCAHVRVAYRRALRRLPDGRVRTKLVADGHPCELGIQPHATHKADGVTW